MTLKTGAIQTDKMVLTQNRDYFSFVIFRLAKVLIPCFNTVVTLAQDDKHSQGCTQASLIIPSSVCSGAAFLPS